MPDICLLFDLDGTLVDSEGLCQQGYLDLLPELEDTIESMAMKYRGRKFANIVVDLESRLGREVPADFEPRYRKRVAELFDTRLQANPGVAELLAALPQPMCVASSAPLAKIRHALAVTGLAPHFGERLFSAYEVQCWKPDPGLFLHAAKAMGFPPNQCVVIEDSEVGLAAGLAAGMRTLHYNPANTPTDHPAEHTFTEMSQLRGLLECLSA
ncbi:HAD-IA family hydrolase [bacterium]|nr:HAD-IA family hydrolase [bacterium]